MSGNLNGSVPCYQKFIKIPISSKVLKTNNELEENGKGVGK
jgi:hypothetical protein